MTGKRVLYQEPQATFFHDVMTNLFTDKMTKAATYYNLHPSNPELMSWALIPQHYNLTLFISS